MDEQRLKRRIESTESIISLREEKLRTINEALALETDPSTIFKLTINVKTEQQEIAKFDVELEELRRLLLSEQLNSPRRESPPFTTVNIHFRMSKVPTGYYHLLSSDESPLVACSVDNPTDRLHQYRATVQILRFSDPEICTIDCPPDSSVVQHFLPTLDRHQIITLTEMAPATVRVTIVDVKSEKVIEERTKRVELHAINTALFAVSEDGVSQWKDLSIYLAAWVTPNVREIQQFLDVVRAHHPQKTLVGYQGATNEAEQIAVVRSQIKAIYSALKQSGSGYVNSVVNFGTEHGQAMQRIRLPRESLTDKSMNCIDGTVLFASLVQAISMNPVIALIPGHAFVGWETWSGSQKFEFLETTMIGYSHFEQALETGNTHFRAAQDRGIVGRPIFDRRGFLRIISLEEARTKGVYPLG